MRSEFLILLELGAVTSKEELHAVLARAFGFPDYYGANKDAFNDCLGDFIEQAGGGRVHVRCRGLARLEERLPEDGAWLRLELEELERDFGWGVARED